MSRRKWIILAILLSTTAAIDCAVADNSFQKYTPDQARLIVKKAKTGDQFSAFEAWKIYHYGTLGIPDDYSALKYAEIAAKGKNKNIANDAKAVIGFDFFQSGDFLEAAKWLEMPASEGNLVAQQDLYIIYRKHRNHDFELVGDTNKAYIFGSLLTKNGMGSEYLDDLNTSMSQEQLHSGRLALEHYIAIHPHAINPIPGTTQQ